MFKHILVPIDFSGQSKEIFHFSCQLAKQLYATLELVHVFNSGQQKGPSARKKSSEQLKEFYEQKLVALTQTKAVKGACGSLSADNEKLRHLALDGLPEEELIAQSKRQEIELMIMGINSTNIIGFNELGRVVSEVAQEIYCPLMLVPPGANSGAFKKILYLNDDGEIDPSLVERISGMAYLFNAEIHFFHINYVAEKATHSNSAFQQSFESQFANQTSEMCYTFIATANTGLLQQINDYIENQDINLIAIMTHDRPFWFDFLNDKLGNSDKQTRNIPLLIMNLEA